MRELIGALGEEKRLGAVAERWIGMRREDPRETLQRFGLIRVELHRIEQRRDRAVAAAGGDQRVAELHLRVEVFRVESHGLRELLRGGAGFVLLEQDRAVEVTR